MRFRLLHHLRRRWKRVMIIAALIGPGIITSNVDNDAGGITTYSMAGAHFGYSLLWSLIPISLALYLIQEMSSRMGVVTGKGLSDLIRERFGIKATFYLLTAIFFTNLGNVISEFAGIAASMELFGVRRGLSVPVAMVLVWLLVVKGTYKTTEKIFLAASTIYFLYILSGVLAHPDWSQVFHALRHPTFSFGPGETAMLVALTGTTIAPWMQFYLQSSIVEKHTKWRDYKYTRLDVFTGSVIVNVVAFFIVVVCGATLFKGGIRVDSAEAAARALEPLAGPYCSILFALGLLNASLFSASILPLSTAYTICEGMGWEDGVNKKFSEAPQFYGLYSILLLFGGGVILLPGVPLIPIMYLSQVINGVVLPAVLVFMLILINNPKVMGEHRNSMIENILVGATIAVVSFLSISLIYMTLRGQS
ncbi:MAG: Nramp family divalent metal transporter [Acidobacteria bacterium]|nr:Nramp family divalent metal transporter [Acidobacteriota bacterium]